VSKKDLETEQSFPILTVLSLIIGVLVAGLLM
jgi:hypothetical protein